MLRKYDKQIALIFWLLILIFLVLFLTSSSFSNWAYERHQNQLSWFIRPLFLIPFCYFAYKRSWAGIAFTIFCIFTSMFWFSKPATITPEVVAFLEFEQEWMSSRWDLSKVLFVLAVPVSFLALGLAFWKRSLWLGLAVIVLMAIGKITWSILNAGESGKSILVPAIIGLVICGAIIYFGFRKLEKKKE